MSILPLPAYAEADNVFHSLCLGCGMCSMICPTHALHPQGDPTIMGCGKRMPQLQLSLCQHCGSCASVCPSDTVQQPRLRELERSVQENPVQTMVFLCRNTMLLAERPADKEAIPPDMPLLRAFASPALSHVQLPPGTRLEVLRCVHRVGARFIDQLVQHGVRNILLLACPEAHCIYLQSAMEHVQQIAILQAVYTAYGIATHLEVREMIPQSSAELQNIIDEFAAPRLLERFAIENS